MPNYNSPKTGFMAKYNADDTTIMVNNNPIYGFGEDTMVTVSYDQDRGTINIDPQGTGVLSVNNKDLATVTLNISESSPSAKLLSDLSADLTEFSVDIRTSTYHYWSNYCLVLKDPDYSSAAAAGNQAWQIKAVNLHKESVNN